MAVPVPMRTALLLMTCVLLPGAVGDNTCIATACIVEGSQGSANCDEGDGGYEFTGIWAGAVNVTGLAFCDKEYHDGLEGHGIHVRVVLVEMDWYAYSSGSAQDCAHAVRVGAVVASQSVDLPCSGRLPPPNPGWGHLLP